MNMNGIWILAQQQGGKLEDISFELLARAKKLSQKSDCELTAVLLGGKIEEAQLQRLIDCGADSVLCVEDSQLEDFAVEPYSKCLVQIVKRYEPRIFIAGATSLGRTLMPYLAIKLKTGLTADCTELDIEKDTALLLQTRPAIGGNILATIKTPNHLPQMATVRPRSYPQAKPIEGSSGIIERIKPDDEWLTKRVVIKETVCQTDEKGLSEADIVVAVGRGIKKAENLKMIFELADVLGAAVGASREVVDRGWLDYPHQIGLSGQTVTPKLYIAIGLSGSIQHMAGMQNSESIIAINKDPNAQIFKVADVGIVGDLFEIVPLLIKKIREGGC